jgi:hypothetical protein
MCGKGLLHAMYIFKIRLVFNVLVTTETTLIEDGLSRIVQIEPDIYNVNATAHLIHHFKPRLL